MDGTNPLEDLVNSLLKVVELVPKITTQSYEYMLQGPAQASNFDI